jgi:RNA polymerase sigma factor (sigma-70 family)
MKTARELNQLPNELTVEQELALLREGSQDARDLLLLHTVKSATRYASALVRGRMPLDELFSMASLALLRAIPKYTFKEDRKPVRLLVYAKPYIRSEIAKAWRFRDPVNFGREDIPEACAILAYDLEQVQDEGGGPDFDLIDLHERWAVVEPHLKKLSETEKRVLILLYEARFAGPEIGRMLGFTRANVREVRNRALRKVRKSLYTEGKMNL